MTVQDDLEDDKWTRGLWRMSTAEEIAEFMSLWFLDRMSNLQIQRMKLGGSGRRMATTRRSQHITSSSLALTVLLTQRRSGELYF